MYVDTEEVTHKEVTMGRNIGSEIDMLARVAIQREYTVESYKAVTPKTAKQ